MKIVIAGSSGFIGSHLVTFFENQGYELVLLSRNPEGSKSHYWNPETQEMDLSLLKSVDVVINLSGESILGRWTQKKMDQILESRLVATQFLCDALLKGPSLPKVYIGASAIGYYGDRPDEVLVESSPSGQGFLAEVCRKWERVPDLLTTQNIRVVIARFGMVLGEGGALKYMEKAFNMGMGGVFGSGQQMMSWISIEDLCSAMGHVIDHKEISGPVNFVSPHAVSNREFTEVLGRLLNRPTLVSIPQFALNMFLGSGSEMFLSSTHVHPQRLLESGYPFQFPDLESTLKNNLINKK